MPTLPRFLNRPFEERLHRPLRRTRRGLSLIEMLIALLILSFAIAGAAVFFTSNNKNQQLARGYSKAQTDMRTALRLATRAIRHGTTVVNPSANFGGGASSSALQLIVAVMDTGATAIEVRFYVLNGTLYQQRSDQAAPGTALMDGVQLLAFSYYLTSGTTRTALSGAAINTATDITMTLAEAREKIPTQAQAVIALRNKVAGL